MKRIAFPAINTPGFHTFGVQWHQRARGPVLLPGACHSLQHRPAKLDDRGEFGPDNSMIVQRTKIFREAGAQISAPPLEAFPEASAATERVSLAFVCGDAPR